METGTKKTDYTPENIAFLIETNRKFSEEKSNISKENLQLKTESIELKSNLEAAEKKID